VTKFHKHQDNLYLSDQVKKLAENSEFLQVFELIAKLEPSIDKSLHLLTCQLWKVRNGILNCTYGKGKEGSKTFPEESQNLSVQKSQTFLLFQSSDIPDADIPDEAYVLMLHNESDPDWF